MKKDYFDDEKQGKKSASSNKRRKKKKMSAGKVILLIVALIVLGLVAFVGTIKILVPDYDLTRLLPEKVQSLINEEKTTSAELTTAQSTTAETPKADMLDYLEDSEFEIDASKQGNFVGNLLNGGKVGTDYTYIYHIVDGKGIYRLTPGSESYSLYYKCENPLSSINLRGDYIYFVDESTSKLQKLQKGTAKPKTVAENVKFVFVYDSNVYYITKDNELCIMDAKELIPTTLYNSADSEMQFIGISKNRVFFSVYASSSQEFYTVDNAGKEDAKYFRESISYREQTGFVMENGYFYYYQRDTESGDSHRVVRQKFGSQKTVELAKTQSNIGYPTADKNKLFYADFADNKLVLKEYNMNSKAEKTMLKSDKLENSDEISFFHGGEYDFIIGEENYKASSNLTSSTNVMKFKNGKWSY